MHLIMLIISCFSGYFGLILLGITFHERFKLKWLPLWIIGPAIIMPTAIFLMGAFPSVPLVIFSIIPIVLFDWWMLSFLIHAKKILLLPVVLLVNAVYRFIGAISGLLLNLLASGKENTVPLKGVFGSTIASIINMAGASLLTLPLIIICAFIAHHYVRKYNFVELLEKLPVDSYDYTLLSIFSILYLIIFTVALQHPVQWQAYAACAFTIGFAALYFQLIVSKYKRMEANQAMQNLNAYGHALSDLNTNLETFSHDYKNIMLGMTQMVNQGDVRELQTYFKDEIQPTLQQFVTHSAIYAQLSNISDDYIRGILFEKYNEATKRNINFNIVVEQKVDCPTTEHLNLIRILGNLLDNALDAAEQSDRLVDVVVTPMPDETQIRISNHFAKQRRLDVTSLSKKYATSKENHRGLGMTSVSRSQTSNMWVTFLIDEQTFSATIHMSHPRDNDHHIKEINS
ncbi:MAG TPA: hypothetical protein DCW31_10910 [Lactobacillus sp.]|nr:hypothetical protein [Lactobacillus sp.]